MSLHRRGLIERKFRLRERRRERMQTAFTQVCSRCGKIGAAFRCSRCHIARYCGKECFSRDWKLHKLSCLPTDCPSVGVVKASTFFRDPHVPVSLQHTAYLGNHCVAKADIKLGDIVVSSFLCCYAMDRTKQNHVVL